jgi:hypothetical protein
MEVVSLCPLPASALLWSAEKRGWSLTVVCKATFMLEPGELALASDQLPLNREPRYWDDDDQGSLFAPSDLAPFKPRVDVLLVGNVHVPKGKTANQIVARLMLGEQLDKGLLVQGDRALNDDGKTSAPKNFKSLELRYEDAFGGEDTLNPVGLPTKGGKGDDGVTRLPNIELAPEIASEDATRMAGFGPVAPTWPSRSKKLTRVDDDWSEADWWGRPLPKELDQSYFNAAPEDQQLESLGQGEEMTLVNLHPHFDHLVTKIPSIAPLAYVEHANGDHELLTMRCDTLFIETDEDLCTLTWRGQMRLDDPDSGARCIIALSQNGKTMSWEDVDRLRADCGLMPWSDRGPDSFGAAIGLRDRKRKTTLGRELHVDVLLPPPASELAPESRSEVISIAPESESVQLIHESLSKLMWFDQGSVRAICEHPQWRKLVRGSYRGDEADTTPSPTKGEESDAAGFVYDVIANGTPARAHVIEAAVAELASTGTNFEAPLVLSAGELYFSFDELAMLRATITVVTPYVSDDATLAQLAGDARALLDLPWLDTAGGTADELTARIRDAFNAVSRPLPPGYLEAQAQRIVVQERRFQRRRLQGRSWIRCSFVPVKSRSSIPTYLPDMLAQDLPMLQHFETRLIAEAHLYEDQYESHPIALKVVALTRVVSGILDH